MYALITEKITKGEGIYPCMARTFNEKKENAVFIILFLFGCNHYPTLNLIFVDPRRSNIYVVQKKSCFNY